MADDGWRLGHRPGLDQLRGVAVLIVVVGHGLVPLGLHYVGTAGVTIFFVLSGFLITRLLLEERWREGQIDLRAFYLRRAARLLPVLPLAFALCAAANSIVGGASVLRPIVAAMTYTTNMAPDYFTFGSFGHMWSLAVEEHFYAIWPLVVVAAPKRWVPWIAGLGLVASSASRILFGSLESSQWTPFRVDAILLGALLACTVVHLRRPNGRLVVAAVVVVGAFMPDALIDPLISWGLTASAVASAVLVVRALTAEDRWPLLERVGRISYGVYLFHMPVMRVAADGWTLPWPIAIAATLAASLGLAELSFRMIEGPAMALARRARGSAQVLGRSQQPSPTVVDPMLRAEPAS